VTPTATPTPLGPVRITAGVRFPKVKVGKSSGRRAANLVNPRTNKGTAIITGVALQSQISPPPPVGFAIQSKGTTCVSGTLIKPGKGCKVFVTFAPMGIGPAIDALVITGNFKNSGQPVALVGVGK
jgi:hypothetical protein